MIVVHEVTDTSFVVITCRPKTWTARFNVVSPAWRRDPVGWRAMGAIQRENVWYNGLDRRHAVAFLIATYF